MLWKFCEITVSLMVHTTTDLRWGQTKSVFAPASDYFAEGLIVSSPFPGGQYNNFLDFLCIVYNKMPTTTEWCS